MFFVFVFMCFCDIITCMKKILLFLLVVVLAACQSATPVVDNVESETACVDAQCQIVRYSMPNGNDLVLETPRHVIQIEAQPNVQYGYYVWAGDKETTEDPDLIVEDGVAMVLIEE